MSASRPHNVQPQARWRTAKRVAHWRESGATQRAPVFKEAAAATDVGESLVEVIGFKRCDALGKHSGQWVADDTIYEILIQVEQQLPDAALCIFRPFETLSCHILDGSTALAAVPLNPKKDAVVIVSDHDRRHFFTILVETFPRQKTVHVFDSLFGRKDAEVKYLLSRIFASDFAGYNFHNYTKHNFTQQPLQSGASCGPWALWIAVVFIFDVNLCRRRRNDEHGRMRVAALKMPDKDVVGFWKQLTV